MPFTSTISGNLGTVAVGGLLTNDVVQQFEAEVSKVVNDGATAVEIDLADVDLICSAAIRVLLRDYKTLSGRGGSLAVVNPSANVQSALETVGFAKLIRQTKPAASAEELTLSGRIDGEAANQLEIDLTTQIREGGSSIGVNMAGVDFLCSAGIRVLLQGYRQMKKDGRALYVLQPSDIAREALETTGFTDLIREA